MHVITHVTTTPAHQSDMETEPIHAALAAQGLLPREHIVYVGYVDSSLVLASR